MSSERVSPPAAKLLGEEIEKEASLFLASYGDLEKNEKFLAWADGAIREFLCQDFDLRGEKRISVGLLVDLFPPEESSAPGLYPPRHLYYSVLPLEERAAALFCRRLEALGYTMEHSFTCEGAGRGSEKVDFSCPNQREEKSRYHENRHNFILRLPERFF